MFVNDLNAIKFTTTSLITTSKPLSADITYYTVSAASNITLTLPSAPRPNTIYYINVIDDSFAYSLAPNTSQYLSYVDLTNQSWTRAAGSFTPKLKAGLHLVSCYYDGTNYRWTLAGMYSET